jgi:hypothetical protein
VLVGTAHSGDDSAIGYASPDAALEALRKNSAAQFSVRDGWTTVSLSEGGSIVMWSFTPKDHPASPAAVKRTMSQKDGAWYLDMKILCGGTKDACDKLTADFNQLNDRMTKDIAAHHGP